MCVCVCVRVCVCRTVHTSHPQCLSAVALHVVFSVLNSMSFYGSLENEFLKSPHRHFTNYLICASAVVVSKSLVFKAA